MDRESQKKTTGDPSAAESMLLLDRYQAGDSEAAAELFDRYVARLIALARSRLSRGMRRRVDPEDVVHSAYRSFFLRAADGAFELQQSGDLWRLLAQITLNKVRNQAERHTAARRDLRRDDAIEAAPHQTTPEPTPEEAAVLVEQIRLVAERLSGDERHTLAAFLQGDSVDEIARQLSKSPRTVRRALARVRALVEREVLGVNPGSGDPEPDVPPLTNPLPYSDFRLERLIDAGGMGKVYRATQLSTGETVAVKALRKEQQTDSRAVRQFLHEAEVVAGLNHPGVIRVHGLGRFPSGGYFLVMNWIDGTDLQSLVDSGGIDFHETLRILRAAAEATSHSHRSGVVHCDLKPGNILLGTDGRVVVTDFGFAHLFTGAPVPTAMGGTIGYLAPELLDSQTSPTPLADIYSLGRILERLTGQHDARAAELISRCVARAPSDRPKSAADFLLALQQIEGAATDTRTN